MHEVGLTGGIGSGKSTVARIFETLGYLVYYADDRAKALTNVHPTVISQIKNAFGEDIYLENGQLDRKKLAGIVFQDKDKLAVLNGIVHPATRQDFADWLDKIPSTYAKNFILKEAAILFESGSYQDMEAVISVYAPKSERLKRVLKRDDTAEAQVLARMDNQWAENIKLRKADFVIYNDGSHPIIPQITEAARFFMAKFENA